MSQTLVQPEAAVELELDELWSFVQSKTKVVWGWIAQSRQTGQVVAYALGDRSAATAGRLWAAIPNSYRRATCYTDGWEAYTGVIPIAQHVATAKQSGATAHIERWNNTLRQRLARFLRKTLSFSKSHRMHQACLLLFLHRHNASCLLSPL